MEGSLIGIIELFITNIQSSDIEIEEEFENKLQRFWHIKRLRQSLNFSHKNHSDFVMPLSNCKENHCLECLESLLEKNCCFHDQEFTPYEKVYINVISKKLFNLNDERILFNRCNVCKVKFDYQDTENRDCRCQVCNDCYIKEYLNLDLSCKVCKKAINPETIFNRASELNIENFEIMGKCGKCTLVYAKSSLVDYECFLCREKKNLVNN